MNTLPPANKVQQVVSVDAQGLVRQAAHVLAVQITIDPADLPAGVLFDDASRTVCVVGGVLVITRNFMAERPPEETGTGPRHRPGGRRSSDRGLRAARCGGLLCRAPRDDGSTAPTPVGRCRWHRHRS